MRFSLALALLFFCITRAAMAAPMPPKIDAIGVHLGSWHSQPDACRQYWGDRDCNNANPGIYIRSGDWAAGGYYNSVRRPTVYVGREWGIVEGRAGAVTVAALAATGYPAAPVVPLAMLNGRLNLNGRAAVQVSYLPRLGSVNRTHVFHLSLELRY